MIKTLDPLPASQLSEHVGFWMGKVNAGAAKQVRPEPPNLTPLGVVGAGPSAIRYTDEIRRTADMGHVWAINSAYAWLLAQEIIPRAMMILDPLPAMVGKLPPELHPETVFYVGSTAHPRLWGRLEGRDVRIFHSQGGANVPTGPGIDFYIGGGPTTITRAPYLACLLGYRIMDLYGADSSRAGDNDRAGGDWYSPMIRVRCNGQEFTTQYDLLAQAEYLRDMLRLPQGDMRVGVQATRDTFIAALLGGDGTYEIINEKEAA